MVKMWMFLLGLAVGAFLNVLIDRLPKEKDVLRGRSYCDHCHHQLVWYDLIPLLSFVFLRGRCRYCQKRISFYNPLVELVTGGMFVWISNRAMEQLSNGVIISLFHYFIISSLIVIFFTDLKYGIIPDKIVFPAIIIAGISNFRAAGIAFGDARQFSIFRFLLPGLGAAGFFGLLVILTKGKGMGLGDVKLAFLMGLVLGFPKIIVALYLAFLTGALVSAILILSKKKKFGQTIPFGPFLVAGTLAAVFWGEQMMGWWMLLFK